jgi:transcriptional regulator with AAA-type ATPase domain
LEWQKSPLERLYLVLWANIKEFKADIREICTSGNMKKQQLHYIIFNRKEVQYIGMHYRKAQLITEKLSAGLIFSTLFQNQIFIILCE